MLKENINIGDKFFKITTSTINWKTGYNTGIK